jgi:hypothetical protein
MASYAGHTRRGSAAPNWINGWGNRLIAEEKQMHASKIIAFSTALALGAAPALAAEPAMEGVFERVTVVAGTFYLGIGESFDRAKTRAYPAGGVTMMPAGMPMFAYTTDEEAIIQIHGPARGVSVTSIRPRTRERNNLSS